MMVQTYGQTDGETSIYIYIYIYTYIYTQDKKSYDIGDKGRWANGNMV